MAAADAMPPASESRGDNADSSAPRKRRRRTAASGAAEDCFTCRRKGSACDRKRPYCTQCIDSGKECSGYRTTLTWGVGVASRGKLRGMSLPVAAKAAAKPQDVKIEPMAAPRRKSSVSSAYNTKTPLDMSGMSAPGSSVFHAGLPTVQESQPIKIEQSRQTPVPRPLRVDIPPVPQTWSTYRHGSMDSMPSCSFASASSMRHGMPLMTPSSYIMSPDQESPFHSSAPSVGTFSDGGFMTPHDFPPTPLNNSYIDAMPSYPYNNGNSYTSNDAMSQFTPSLGTNDAGAFANGSPFSSDGCASNANALSVVGYCDTTVDQQDVIDSKSQSSQQGLSGQDDVFQHFELAMDDMLQMDHAQQANALTLDRPLFSTQFFHLSHRMQSLIDFYDKHICSVLVAFDGQANPYRYNILNLAVHNQGLQNAIAALATCNIRMRSQKQLQGPEFIRELEENGADALSESRLALSAPTAEESCYKALSIEQLNMQLAHASSAEDDAVLATLLILCLFHVCDSGFAKFRTQLTGVQKLLSLRGPSRSGFTGWVRMFFTWFDVLCSTCNDRETEMDNSSSDTLDLTTDLGALEEYSGCDGRLFKLIARLGRLNLLAQQRPVRTKDEPATLHPQLPSDWQLPIKSHHGHAQDLYGLDGNGWSSPVSNSLYPDGRADFWHEWHDVRSNLQSWSMDYAALPGPRADGGGLSSDQRDFVHINEAYRASALLYTERLAHPDLPSSAPNFQQLVAQGLFHINALEVTSCVNKYLLWPLFMVGSECVDREHRATVRTRAVEIQRESGFFNNFTVLQVLERTWADVTPPSAEGQPFKWRRAMDRSDGEYIVV